VTAMKSGSDNLPLIAVTTTVGGVAALLIGVGRWIAVHQPDLSGLFLEEGGLLEWLAFLALLFASVALCAVHRVRRRRDGLPWGSLPSVGMMILAGAMLFGALEEISWGQHLLRWNPPGFFRTHNLQAETNIHNLEILGTQLNAVLFDRLLFAVVALHNVVLPLAALRAPRLRQLVERIGGFLPPVPLVVVFLVTVALAHAIGIRRPAELPEATGALHYLASILVTYGLGYGTQSPIARTASARRRAAPVIALVLVSLVVAAVLLTVLTTGKPLWGRCLAPEVS
jgi:hypothetical protein